MMSDERYPMRTLLFSDVTLSCPKSISLDIAHVQCATIIIVFAYFLTNYNDEVPLNY